ncbi:MAG: hypothetical protein IPH04_05765 [Saprospirales bacterium]|nr:hypothetical protein [Saprospirales bacterium]
METLEIVIGLIFIFLLLSLFATTVQELLSSLIALRGKILLKAVTQLLEVDTAEGVGRAANSELAKAFKEKVKGSKVYQKYSGKFMGLKQLPSYLTADQVTALISELMEKEAAEQEQLPTARGMAAEPAAPPMLTNMRQKDLQRNLSVILQGGQKMDTTVRSRGIFEQPQQSEEELASAETMVDKAKAAFKKQYDEIMDRATGWYKKAVQAWLLAVGLLIAISFDADTFKIWNNLTHNPESRNELLALATNFVDEGKMDTYTATPDSTSTDTMGTLDNQTRLKGLVDSLLYNEINKVPAPLGLGWDASLSQQLQNSRYAEGNSMLFFIRKFFGWLITALAISLGAPFWFDMLQKVISIRNAGVRPQDAEKEQAKADRGKG